MQKWNTEFKS